jgi:tryptophanyl-tRNA synthetase
MAERINPWGDELIRETEKLFAEFGLQHLDESISKRIKHQNRLFRRGILFAHRDFDKFLDSAEKKEKVAVMSGIKPSGDFHLGSKLTAEEMIFLQKELGAKMFYCVADLEAYADNGITLKDGAKTAVDNVCDLLALGMDADNAFVYKQSANKNVSNLAFLFSRKTTLNTLEALYGHQNLGLYQSVLIQAGDILQPQLDEFNGPKRVVVPVGLDQDPHIRFTRDLAFKFREEFGFTLPSSTYHHTFRSLDGGSKMSKRNPMGMLSLGDSLNEAEKKVLHVLTGGRATVAEQKKLGGEYGKCVNAELDYFHFEEDDAKVAERKRKCLGGEIMCGECKREVCDKVIAYLKAHQEKKRKMRGKAEKLLE